MLVAGALASFPFYVSLVVPGQTYRDKREEEAETLGGNHVEATGCGGCPHCEQRYQVVSEVARACLWGAGMCASGCIRNHRSPPLPLEFAMWRGSNWISSLCI